MSSPLYLATLSHEDLCRMTIAYLKMAAASEGTAKGDFCEHEADLCKRAMLKCTA